MCVSLTWPLEWAKCVSLTWPLEWAKCVSLTWPLEWAKCVSLTWPLEWAKCVSLTWPLEWAKVKCKYANQMPRHDLTDDDNSTCNGYPVFHHLRDIRTNKICMTLAWPLERVNVTCNYADWKPNMTSYSMPTVMLARSLTDYDIFAKKYQKFNLENERHDREVKKNGTHAVRLQLFDFKLLIFVQNFIYPATYINAIGNTHFQTHTHTARDGMVQTIRESAMQRFASSCVGNRFPRYAICTTPLSET